MKNILNDPANSFALFSKTVTKPESGVATPAVVERPESKEDMFTDIKIAPTVGVVFQDRKGRIGNPNDIENTT